MSNKLVFGLATLVVVTGVALLTISDWLPSLLLKPDHEFFDEDHLAAPDYSDPENWAALPGRLDAADEVPPGIVPPPEGERAAAVFYIYPTINLSKARWNMDLSDKVLTNLADQFPIKGQATAFNGCCEIYAPHYRQATLYTFLDSGPSPYNALELAYLDVERAFDEFLTRIGDKPIILAGHSQGTNHLIRLLQERIDNELYERIVAVYAIGGHVPLDLISPSRVNFSICDGPDETQCIIAWDTFIDGSDPLENPMRSPGHWVKDRYGWTYNPHHIVCVNPLSWRFDTQPSPVANHKGGLEMDTSELGDVFRGERPDPSARSHLRRIIPNVTFARCEDDGRLSVRRQEHVTYGGGPVRGDGLHLVDYGLFWKDIYDNAIARVTAFVGDQ